MATQPVQRPEGRFDGPNAAIAGRPLDGSAHLAAGPGRYHAGPDGRGRPARRPARRTGGIERVAGRSRIGRTEFGCHGLGQDGGAALAQRHGMGAVLVAAITPHGWAVGLPGCTVSVPFPCEPFR